MQHPDEGTIHAWLDGALDEPEAARLAAHVATCAECEARVVEARGLIAGASRVLSALDAVPGDVIPPAREPEREVPARATRHWWRRRGITPALAAAAAVAFVAVGSTLVVRQTSKSEMTEMVAHTNESADTARPEPARSAPASQKAIVRATDRGAAAEPSVRRDAVGRVGGDSSASAPRNERVSDEAPRALTERAPSPLQRSVPAAPPSVAAATAGAAAPTPSTEAFTGARSRKAAAPMPAARPEAGMEQRASADLAPRAAVNAPRPSFVGSFAGCYRVVGGERGALPPEFVLDTLPASALGWADTTPDGRKLATQRMVRYTNGVALGMWTALGPTARVVIAGSEGASMMTLRADTASRADIAVEYNGTVRTVTLARCEER